MPALKQINCSIELGPSNVRLPEYGTIVRDGYIETFIAVPDTTIPFTVHIKTKGYIGPGLAFFVFMDGEYQCNRNRTDLKIPAPELERNDYEAEFRLRQKEEKTGDGRFIAREWSFAKLDRVKADGAPNTRKYQYVENLGTIEIIVLRCHVDGVEPARLVPDRARETKATPIAAHVRDTKKAAKAPSIREDELGGLFGLFDGADDDEIDATIVQYDASANDIPSVADESSNPIWDSSVGEYMQGLGHRRWESRAPAEYIARGQSLGSNLQGNSLHEFAHRSQYAQPEDFADVAGMIECNPESLDAGPTRDKSWDSLLARFRAIFVQRNPYTPNVEGLRAFSDDIAEYEMKTQDVKQHSPATYAEEEHDLPMVHELKLELQYMRDDVRENGGSVRTTDRQNNLSSLASGGSEPNIEAPPTPSDSTHHETASGSTCDISSSRDLELSVDLLALDGAGDNREDPEDIWKDSSNVLEVTRAHTLRQRGLPNAGGWQEVGGGTALNAQPSRHAAFGHAPAQYVNPFPPGFQIDKPQKVRFRDPAGNVVQPNQGLSISLHQPPMKEQLDERPPHGVERDRSPGRVWGMRNGPIDTKEEYQRFLKWQEKYYGYAEDSRGRRYKINKDKEEDEKPRGLTREECYANGLNNPEFEKAFEDEEMKRLGDVMSGRLKKKSEPKSESSYSHGFGNGDGDANHWNDTHARFNNDNNSPKQHTRSKKEQDHIDNILWGTTFSRSRSPPGEAGRDTAAPAGGNTNQNNREKGDAYIIWNPNYDHTKRTVTTDVVDIDGAFRRRREKAEREKAELEKAGRERAKKASKHDNGNDRKDARNSDHGSRQKDTWKPDNGKRSKDSWGLQNNNQGAGWNNDNDQIKQWDQKNSSKTQSVRSYNKGSKHENGGIIWFNKDGNKNAGDGNRDWQNQGNNGGWGNDNTWPAQGNNNDNQWDQPKNDKNSARNTTGWDSKAQNKPASHRWDNESQSKPASNGWATASQSKSKTESQAWDNESRNTSKTASNANWASNEPKEARTRRVTDDVNSKDHIKSYWKAWNQPLADDAAAIKKRDLQRDAYKYPAMPRPTVPSDEAKDKSHGVQIGKGADYSHQCRRPIYLDSMEEPYAVFTFKYRSKRAVEKILNVKVDEVDYKKIEEEIEFQKMMSMSKEELAKENARLKMRKDRHYRQSTAASARKSERSANDGWEKEGGEDAGNGSWGGGSKKPSHRGGNRDDGRGDAGGWAADGGTAPAANFW